MNKAKLLFLIIIFSVFSLNNLFSSTSYFDLNFGLGATMPIKTVKEVYKKSANIAKRINKKGGLSEKEKKQIKREVANTLDVLNRGLRYEAYVQMGANLNDFLAIGGDILFNFNVFKPINNDRVSNSNNVFAMGLGTNFYTKLNFSIFSLTFLTGPEIDMEFLKDSGSILKDSAWLDWNIGARFTIGCLMLRGNYAWNVKKPKLSDFDFGLGLEFSIL